MNEKQLISDIERADEHLKKNPKNAWVIQFRKEKQEKLDVINTKTESIKLKPEIKIVDESDKNYKWAIKNKFTHKVVWEDSSCNYFEGKQKAEVYLKYDKNKERVF